MPVRRRRNSVFIPGLILWKRISGKAMNTVELLANAIYFPNDHILNLSRELKLLSIPGSVLNAEELQLIRKLAESMEKLFRWFDAERREAYPALTQSDQSDLL